MQHPFQGETARTAPPIDGKDNYAIRVDPRHAGFRFGAERQSAGVELDRNRRILRMEAPLWTEFARRVAVPSTDAAFG
jgi:hypothetical protein